MKVEVNLEDLECIVFATAVIKTIEGALASRKTDPFVRPHLDYTMAHDNLVSAMNAARRTESGTAVGWDDPLTEKEVEFLKEIDEYNELNVGSSYYPISGSNSTFLKKKERADSLACKGCVRIGQSVEGIIWPGDKQPELHKGVVFVVQITQRGLDKLNSI